MKAQKVKARVKISKLDDHEKTKSVKRCCQIKNSTGYGQSFVSKLNILMWDGPQSRKEKIDIDDQRCLLSMGGVTEDIG